MSYASWREKMKKNAEVIFDREEPVGQTTDMVLPDRRWLRKRKTERAAQPLRVGHRLTSA
jgi:hypothetical protein